jgi:hypothetical protein
MFGSEDVDEGRATCVCSYCHLLWDDDDLLVEDPEPAVKDVDFN